MLLIAGYWPGMVLTVFVIPVVLFTVWYYRENLSFIVALCVSTTILAVPVHIYDEILLACPILWVYSHRESFSGRVGRRLLILLDLSLAVGWVFQILLAVLYLMNPRVALLLWELPVGLTAILPYAAILPLLYFAFCNRDKIALLDSAP
jgi:hypothetical protein